MQGQEPNMQVAIHAGAAFTDEGRLSRSLRANKNVLSEQGVATFGPRRYRQVFKPAFAAPPTRPLKPQEIDQVQAALPSDPQVRRTVFLSNDLIADGKSAIQHGQFYPLAGQRMSLLDQALGSTLVELFFSLRNPGSFVPKLLMSLPDADRENITRSTDLSCLSWTGMIDDIRDLAPEVKITLWSNEESPFLWGDIVRSISGLPEDTPIQGEHDLLLSLLTEAGKEKAQEIVSAGSDQNQASTRDALAEVLEEHARPDMVEEELELPGWNNEIVEAFSELYEQDLARLETMPGVRLLRP